MQHDAITISSTPASLSAESFKAGSVEADSPANVTQRIIPNEIREQCIILFEETLYSQALRILFSLLQAIDGDETLAFTAPADFLALIFTLSVAPALTNRASSRERWNASILARRYLRLTFESSPSGIFESLRTSILFRARDRSSRGAWRTSKSNDDSEPNSYDFKAIKSPLVDKKSLWTLADDFWHTVGWSFNCSVLHLERWEIWRDWLELMLDILERDWHQKGEDAIILRYLQNPGRSQNNLKRVIRAVFADGSSRSVIEFPEIWPSETKSLSKDERKRTKPVDIIENDYGDYDDEDDDHRDNEQTTIILPKVREEADEIEHSLGDADALKLRMRLLAFLTRVADESDTISPSSTTLYETCLDQIRLQPLSCFFDLISIPGLEAFSFTNACTLVQFILKVIIAANAPNIDISSVNQQLVIKHYLPFAANKATITENARVSLCIETLLRQLDENVPNGLEWTPQLHESLEMGIEARLKKGKKPVEDLAWLNASADRMRFIVRMSLRRMESGITATGLTSQDTRLTPSQSRHES